VRAGRSTGDLGAKKLKGSSATKHHILIPVTEGDDNNIATSSYQSTAIEVAA